VEQLKYLGITLTNQNSIKEEIKSKLKSGNACYHSVQNFLSSISVSKNIIIKIYIILIVHAALYGYETWSPTLREERRLRVFENRSIFGHKRDKVTGEWRRLHNEELDDMYSAPNIIRVIKSRRMSWSGHVSRMRERIGAYRVLVGKPERKIPLVIPSPRWEDNIKMGLQEVGWGGAWTGLIWLRTGTRGGHL
jgi:hypothetical protein